MLDKTNDAAAYTIRYIDVNAHGSLASLREKAHVAMVVLSLCNLCLFEDSFHALAWTERVPRNF